MKHIGSKWQTLLPPTQLLLACTQALEHISVLCCCMWSFKTVLLWSSRSTSVHRLETLLGLEQKNKRNSGSNCDMFTYGWVLGPMCMNRWKGWGSSGCALFRSTGLPGLITEPTALFLPVWTRVMLTLTQLQQHRQIWICIVSWLLFASSVPQLCPGPAVSLTAAS